MMTKAQLKTVLVDNLQDDRLFAIQAYLEALIERRTYGGGINQYRIKDSVTNSYITSLSDFISKLDANSLFYSYDYNCRMIDVDKTHPFILSPGNFIVELDPNSGEDSLYTSKFGEGLGQTYRYNIFFYINYLADIDTTLPLKITDVRLVWCTKG